MIDKPSVAVAVSATTVAGLSELADQLEISFLLFGGFAVAGGIAKVLVELQNQVESIDPKKAWFRIISFALIAFPMGTISGSVAFETYGNIWMGSGASLITGTISASLITWLTSGGWKELLMKLIGGK